MKDLVLKLEKIQKELNAPKSQLNKFGGYHYRNCEDILQAVKPLLDGCIITITDKIECVGERFYIKATATITDGTDKIETSAYARESLSKKGMDDSQLTGSTSSYARKYALNGLLLIDDNKDADSDNNKEDGYTLDETAKAWIDAIKSGSNKLEEIEDLNYRKFIGDNLNG